MSQGPSNLYGQQTSANSVSVVLASDSAVTIFNGTADAGNSSTTPLGANAAFTGTSFDAFNQGAVLVTVQSDQSSAAQGLAMQWSTNGTNWDETDFNTFTANKASGAFSIQATERARYFRVVYTNGPVAQTTFRLQTIHRITTPSGDVLELSDPIDISNHAQLVRTIAGGTQPVSQNTAFPTISMEAGGNLENTALLLREVVVELRMLRQSFQDWTGQSDARYDATEPIIKHFQ